MGVLILISTDGGVVFGTERVPVRCTVPPRLTCVTSAVNVKVGSVISTLTVIMSDSAEVVVASPGQIAWKNHVPGWSMSNG